MYKRVKMGGCIKVMNVQHEKESTLHNEPGNLIPAYLQAASGIR